MARGRSRDSYKRGMGVREQDRVARVAPRTAATTRSEAGTSSADDTRRRIAVYAPVRGRTFFAMCDGQCRDLVLTLVDLGYPSSTTIGSLSALANFVVHRLVGGDAPDVRAMLTDANIEGYFRDQVTRGVTPAGAQSIRASLRLVARANHLTAVAAKPVGVVRAHVAAAYTTEEKFAHYRLLDRIGGEVVTDFRVVLDLSYGCGSRPAEADRAVGADVRPYLAGALVTLTDGTGLRREVPVAGPAAERLLARAATVGDANLIRPGSTRRQACVRSTYAVRKRAPGLSFLVDRARYRWIIDQLDAGLPAAIVIDAAGLQSGGWQLGALIGQTKRPAADVARQLMFDASTTVNVHDSSCNTASGKSR